jgi:hypothetical protein
VAFFTFVGHRLQFDDGLIYDRYVRNAFQGHGLVFNAGERINALTSPLYAYVLLGVTWILHGQVQMAAVLIFGTTFAGTCLLAERLVPYSGIFIGSMAYFYASIGMETSLLLLLILAIMTLYLDSRLTFIPLLMALLILTRIEAGALALPIGWRMWKDRRFPSLVSFLPALATIVAYLVVNIYLFGKLIPVSGSAKLGQGMSGYWGVWPTAFLHIWHLWRFFQYTAYVAAGIIILGVLGIWRERGSLWGMIALQFVMVLFLFYWLFNLPAYYWYYAPFILCLTIFAVIAVPKKRAARLVMGIVMVGQIITNAFCIHKLATDEHDYAKIGAWLALRTTPDATVAACEIGELGWQSHRYIYDILGLTTPRNALHVAQRDAHSWLTEDKPDYIVVHRPAWIWEQTAVSSSEYSEISFHSNSVYILCRKQANISSTGNGSCVKLSKYSRM